MSEGLTKSILAPKRHLFRFGLGTMLLVVAALALVLSGYSNQARIQRHVTAELEKFGGQHFYDYQTGFSKGQWRYIGPREPPEPVWLQNLLGPNYFASLAYVSIADYPTKPVTDDILLEIFKLRGLKRLDIVSNRITDQGLAHIGKLDELQELCLVSTAITDDGLSHIKSMKRLNVVSLIFVKASAEGVRELRQSLPNCKVLATRWV